MKIKKLTESVKLVEEDDELNPIEASTAEAAKDVIEGGDDSNANMLGNGASMNGVINNERKDTGETENGN